MTTSSRPKRTPAQGLSDSHFSGRSHVRLLFTALLPLREKVAREAGRMSNCVLSGVLSAPFLTGAQEGDEDAEHFSADGDDRHFGCFALGDEALAEGHQGRVAAGGGQ